MSQPMTEVQRYMLVVYALNATVLSLRRCKTTWREKTSRAEILCCRPATWRRNMSPGMSYYSCDLCLLLKGEMADERLPFDEAPHARSIRAFVDQTNRRIAPEDMLAYAREQMLPIACDLLLALPPCPLPLSGVTACPRCIWGTGVPDDGAVKYTEEICATDDSRLFVARMNLLELTKTVANVLPEPFSTWPRSGEDETNRLLAHVVPGGSA